MKLWLLYTLGRISRRDYLIARNIALGAKIDAIRAERLAIKAELSE